MLCGHNGTGAVRDMDVESVRCARGMCRGIGKWIDDLVWTMVSYFLSGFGFWFVLQLICVLLSSHSFLL